MTKEELIKENAILKQNNSDLGEQNTKLNADFCKVLGFSYYENDYGTRKQKIEIKSWAEIFSEIGKLKAMKDFRKFEGNIADLERQISELNRVINSLTSNS